jgi:methionyl-tRNA formyltransferase
VLTQPDRPAGRGMAMHYSAVKQVALAHALPLAQPRSLRLDGRFAQDAEVARAAMQQARAQAMVVAAYGLILPRWVLDMYRPPGTLDQPRFGCLNIHASLLPRWRGAAPIHRAIEAGDSSTGVCIMQMEEGLDTGPVVVSRSMPIEHQGVAADTSASLHDRLASLGAELIVQVLQAVPAGALIAQTQPQEGVCYARKVDKSDARIDWVVGAPLVERRIRAFNPAPGAWTLLGEHSVKVWRAQVVTDPVPDTAIPGQVVNVTDAGIDVACGGGAVRLLELQRAGGRRLVAAEFLRGFAMHAGQHFGSMQSGDG